MNDSVHGGVTAAQSLGGTAPRGSIALGATTGATGAVSSGTSGTMSTIDTSHLVEVWGDTVDSRHLAWSIVLGVAISVGAFAIANRGFALFVHDAAMSRAYAMLVGLLACLVAGAICARLFKPKRSVVEETADAARLQSVVDQLAAEPGGLGRVADLPPAVAAEMKELGLYDIFEAAERRIGIAASAASAVSTSTTETAADAMTTDLARDKECV